MEKHVLVCPFTKHTWGHLVRTLAIADVLVARGARVTLACGAEARSVAHQAGVELVEHVSINQDLLQPDADRARAQRWYGRALERARALVRRVAPDVVVTDLQPMLNVAAALEGVPSAAVLNLELLRDPFAWWRIGLARVLTDLDLPRWAASRVLGDLLLVCDTPETLGLRELAPQLSAVIAASVREVRFVGPILRGTTAITRRRRRASRPAVVISLGGGNYAATTAAVLAGCAGIAADFIVIAAPSKPLRVAATALERSGATVKFVDFIADFASRLQTVDALITHGGHGTVVQSLALAVPTLIVPNTIERELNARRMRGVGEIAATTPSQIRATLGAQLAFLLSDRSRDAARRRIAKQLSSYGGAREAALAIERLARLAQAGME